MKLDQIPIAKIHTNPDNPRGIDITSQDPKLSYLKDSIDEFGIMVPLVLAKHRDGYMLIDGERRYWAAIALKLDKVPAYILDEKGTLNSNDILFRMFQIHHNREQWGPVQQCHALEALYKKLCAMKSIAAISDVRAQLRAISDGIVESTGMESQTAMTRVYFLRWPMSVKQRLYSNPNEEGYWYVCEIEGKIIIPAIINYPEYFEKVAPDEVRIELFRKLEENTVDRSVDVRKVAPYFRERMSTDQDRKKLLGALKRLHSNTSTTYGEVQEELLRDFPHLSKPMPVSPRKLLGVFHGLQRSLDEFDYTTLAKKTKGEYSSSGLISAARQAKQSLEKFIELAKSEDHS